MPDRFTLLTLSFSLILRTVCSWDVSVPLNPVLNDDGSVSVTCMFKKEKNIGMEAKLMMNDKIVCEIYKTDQEDKPCKWKSSNNGFTFTLMNPGALHKNEFSCQISKISPLPIETFLGPKTKLFRACNTSWDPPQSNCSCVDGSRNQEHTVEDKPSPEDMYTFLICGLVIAVTVLCLYSLIITAFYMRLRDATPEPSDNLTYVPMQRNIKWRDPDDTEYVDMREVQKRGGSHRDMNHNSHMITA